MRQWICVVLALVVAACAEKQPKGPMVTDVMNRMTPVKDQGKSQSCWIYAMLAAIETEHLLRGDSVNLSPAYIEKMLEHEPAAPKSGRGMGATLIAMIEKYGVVGYDAMRSRDVPAPRWVFMLGAQYTPLEFAHSVCAPEEYVLLTSDRGKPYGEMVDVELDDNWLHNKFLNVNIDTLLHRTECAVKEGHGVCWESASHAMSIVGLAHDERGRRYFIMKNSWGSKRGFGGLDYVSFGYFRKHTLAVEMTREAFLPHGGG